jgi:hypothetical protein
MPRRRQRLPDSSGKIGVEGFAQGQAERPRDAGEKKCYELEAEELEEAFLADNERGIFGGK